MFDRLDFTGRQRITILERERRGPRQFRSRSDVDSAAAQQACAHPSAATEEPASADLARRSAEQWLPTETELETINRKYGIRTS